MIMKYHIKTGDKTFEVEIDDINTRPIIARVDGQEFEVLPFMPPAPNPREIGVSPLEQKPSGSPAHSHTGQSRLMFAPLPGTVIDIFIKPGDEVETGQVVMIIDAMKMKNSIRSVRDGIVAAVPVNKGQNVAHKQTLLEFTE
jgi:biotin carboxyl carrier protein